MAKWLAIVGVDGESQPVVSTADRPADLSVAVWETVSGGTTLGTIEPPAHPWIIAVEGNNQNDVDRILQHILKDASISTTDTPEMFEEIYRRDDAADIADDDRDVFYARVQAHEAVLAPLNDWYNHVHLPEVGAAGLTAGQRFKSHNAERTFLALYRPETLDVLRSDAIAAVRGLGGFENDIEQFSRMEARVAARWPAAVT